MQRDILFGLLIIGLLGIVALIAYGGSITNIWNNSGATGVQAIVAQVSEAYPAFPYTTNTLPSTETDSFVALQSIPRDWRAQGTCPAGARQSPNKGCWSLIIDAVGINFFLPRLPQDLCLKITSALDPTVYKKVVAVAVNTDGDSSLTGAVDLTAMNASVRPAAVATLGRNNCRDAVNNQLVLTMQ